MNGIHDMGGMQGMGPVPYEHNEPVFHAAWESRVFALIRAMRAWDKWNVDTFRRQIELIPAADYLRMSYYERWFAALIELLAQSGLVTRSEIARGKPSEDVPRKTPPVSAGNVMSLPSSSALAKRDLPLTPRFKAGDVVRARNIHPTGHTRLPRYARGKLGNIDKDHGVYVFPDTNAEFLGEKPQHLYSVRFQARELWGDEASPRDAVYLDMWEDYLEPA